MPIQNVLIEATEGSIFLSTNLDLGIKCSIMAEVEEKGSVTLPVKELLRIVRELADMEVNVSSSDTPKQPYPRGSIFNIVGMRVRNFHHFQN